MAHEVPTTEPLSVTAGDLVTWKRSLANYLPSDGWVLSYALTKSSVRIEITSSTSGSDHLVSVAASTTASWAAGNYLAQGYVTKSATSERYQVFQGNLKIEPNLAAQSSGYDGRSHARKCLDAIESVLEARAGKAVQSWSGLEQSFSLIPTPDLLTMRDKYRVEYQSEQAASNIARGLGNKSNVFVRFTTPR
jgi:hypothetical protein